MGGLDHSGFFLKVPVRAPQHRVGKAFTPDVSQGAWPGGAWRAGAQGTEGGLTPAPAPARGAGGGPMHLLLLLPFQNTFLWPPGLLSKMPEWLWERRAVADG